MARIELSKRRFVAGLAAAMPLLSLAGAARADTMVRVPFRYYHDVLPVIPVHIDGKGPYWFLFTTSIALNTINDDLATGLALKPVNRIKNFLLGTQTISAGNKEAAHQVAADDVTIGDGYDLRGVQFDVSVNTTEKARDWHARHVHDDNFPNGGLGMQVFTSAPCVLDYEARELRLYPDGVPGLADYSALNSQMRGSIAAGDIGLTVTGKLGGDGLKCYVDTAGVAELYLASHYVRSKRLYELATNFTEEPLDRTDPSKGTMRTVRMKNFDLGGVRFDEINVTLGDPAHDDHLHELGIKAVIGRGLWRQFSMAFPGDGRILLKPNSSFKAVSDPYRVVSLPD